MIRFALVIGLMLLPSMGIAQTSFDEHFSLAKSGRLGPREAEFSRECGVDRASAVISYGRSTDERWTFKRVSSVGHGRNDAEMDYLGNAELWSIAGRPRLLNVWFLIMDTGNSTNELLCLDVNGRVTKQESLNVYEPLDRTIGGWRHLMTTEYPAAGKPRRVKDVFLDTNGMTIATPKLSHDDLEEANGHSSPDLAKDLIAKISHKDK